MTAPADQISQLEAAIAAQEDLRRTLGNAAVDTAVGALRDRLEQLRSGTAQEASPTATPDDALALLRAQMPVALAEKARVSTASRRAEGERRNVSVLFADLSGFTALSERFDPEVIRAFQEDLFREMASVVYQYEGFVEKFVGDSILSIFGAPVTHEDDAERALRTALAIRERMDAINRRWADRLGQPLTLHIGINTGTVVAGQIEAELGGGYAVTGDTINTASRIQTAAQPGQILVSLKTHRLTHEAFVFRPLEPLRVAGKREALTVFELERAKLHPGKSRGLQGLASPIIGRDRELGQLTRVSDELLAGNGQVVLVAGEAGIGKSRLMAEWHDDLVQRVRWIEGRSFAHATAFAYGPFLDMFRRYSGIKDEDSDSRARQRLRDAVERVLPGDSDANAVIAHALGMRPAPEDADIVTRLSAQALRQRLFEAIEAVFSALAEQQPTILVMEDVHWADSSSIELLEHLLPLTERLPLAMVLVFRSGPNEFPLQSMVRSTYRDRLTELALTRLPDASTHTMVEELLSSSEVLGGVQALVIRKAEGNPLFVEEVIRSLIERGALVRDEQGEAWIATSLIDSVSVPDTLQGVLMARLDRLPDETKWVAQQASVIGRYFLYRVLLKLSDATVGMEADLTHLEREEIIRELTRDPEVEYLFKHALTQEVAYSSLLAPQRRDLHARVGAAMEELFAERIGEFSAIVGRHFLRGEVWEKAFSYFVTAGDAATGLHAHPEARLHYEQALLALSHLPSTDEGRQRLVDVTLKEVAVSWGAENPEHNLARLAEVEKVARTLAAPDGSAGPDLARLARVHYWMGRIHYYRDELRDAIGYFKQVLSVAQALGDEKLLAIPMGVMGRALVMQGHFGKAAEFLARAGGPLQKAEEWLDWAYSSAYLGVALSAAGQRAAGVAESDNALERARETDNPTAIAGCLIVVAFQSFLSRDPQAFSEIARAAADEGERAGSPLLAYIGLAFDAWGLSMQGRHDEAGHRMAQADVVAEPMGGRLVAADWIAAAKADLALNAGEAELAIDQAQRAVEMARGIGGLFGEALAQRVWGQALAARTVADREGSDAHLAAAIELFEAGGCRLEAAHTHLARGLLCRERGDIADARDQLRLAAAVFEEAELPRQLEIARAAMAQAV